MGFVQIIEFRSNQIDKMEAVGEEWKEATAGKRLAHRRVLCADRDNPGRYFNVVFFDSYEEAMKNSAMPETNEFSQRMMSLAEGPPTFYNLDVVQDESL